MNITGENCTYNKGKVLEKYYTGDESCNAYTEKYECGGEYNNNYGDVNGCEDHLCFWSCIKCKYLNSINTSKNSTKNIKNITSKSNITLTNEQSKLISLAQEGKNVLVDACIGSGKTTTIQELCNVLYDKSILYLTYNKQLKFDAQSKIKNSNVKVTNYHGYASSLIRKSHLPWPGIEQIINSIIENKNKVLFEHFDLLLLDEYQDIDQEISDLLILIKEHNPNIQIIAVGDMSQKIYDKDYLNVIEFIDSYLNKYETLSFTNCFRLSSQLANILGDIWKKDIKGINNTCDVCTMSEDEVIEYLSDIEPKDILVVGANPTINEGTRNRIFNKLNTKYENKFNKKTSFVTMMDGYGDEDRCKNNKIALFLTYDKCKGLERPIEVICDFDLWYWNLRCEMPNAKYEIIRNIFCVAASRGKQKIIFVSKESLINLYKNMTITLSTPVDTSYEYHYFEPSSMFDYKYSIDLKKCYELLNIIPLTIYKETIDIKTSDYLIDLSPCIGLYQETYFNSYNFKKLVNWYIELNRCYYPPKPKGDSLDDQILYLTALSTKIYRYVTQVNTPFISNEEKQLIYNRLSTKFTKDESSQIIKKSIGFKVKDDIIPIFGKYDVMKDNIIYELKFVSTLDITHYLQLAMYLLIYNVEKGILWNTRDNSEYEVTIKDRQKFINEVIRTCTKGYYTEAELITLPKED